MIVLKDFKGVVPKLRADKLPDNAAKEAINCDFSTGGVTGIRGGKVTSLTGSACFPYTGNDGVVSLYAVADADADFVRSPVRQDAHKRFYWTSSNGFRFARAIDNTAPSVTTSYKVGVADFNPLNSLLNNAKDKAGVAIAGADGVSQCVGGIGVVPLPISKFITDEVAVTSIKLFLENSSGETVREVTGDMVAGSFKPVAGVETYRGWARQFEFEVTQTADSYANTAGASESGYQYFTFAGNIPDANLSSVPMAAWGKKVNGTMEYHYFKTLDGATVDIPPGTAITIQEVGSGLNTRAYVLTPSTFSYNGGSMPALSSNTEATADMAGLRFSFTIDLKVGNTTYTNAIYEGEGEKYLNGPQEGMRWTLAKAGEKKYLLNLKFGRPLGMEARSYIMTLVNNFGEESGPFGPFDASLDPGTDSVELYWLTSWLSTLTSATDRVPLNCIRVYSSAGLGIPGKDYAYKFAVKLSTANGDLPGEVYKAASTVSSSLVVIDDMVSSNGDACPTVGFVSNVNELQELRGLTTLYNGILGAFKGNEFWLSEPYQPWAWRRRNVHTLPHKIVALLPQEQGVYVLTEGHPYYASGATPEDMVPTKLVGQFPCVSKKSATVINGQAIYVSPDGPVFLSGADARLDPGVFSREIWRRDIAPFAGSGGVVGAAAYSNRLLLYFSPAIGTTKGYLYHLESGNVVKLDGISSIDGAMSIPAGAMGEVFDNLAVRSGTSWSLFGEGASQLPWVYESKEFILPKPISLGAVQIFGDGAVSFKVFADGVLKHTASVEMSPTGTIIRLPSGFRSAKWSFRFEAATGSAFLREAVVAVSPKEFQGA